MWDILQNTASLIDMSGYIIIAAIIVLLFIGIIVMISCRARYGSLERDLRSREDISALFKHRVLNRIVREAEDALAHGSGEVNTQAIVEHNFQRHLKSLMIGERFVKSTTGLLIILGLVGTFYGLTLSIGKLVVLVSGDVSQVNEITQTLTRGLVQALSGMSVAFSTSLFGILAAILMTLLGVFFNVADRRTRVMVEVEAYLDNTVVRGQSRAFGQGDAAIANMVDNFGQSVGKLEQVIARFDAALAGFSENTRDFGEFNMHLKDNIQRMSLSFSDFGQTLKSQVQGLGPRGRG